MALGLAAALKPAPTPLTDVIPASVKLCMAEFEHIQDQLLDSEWNTVHAGLVDESGRFRTWVANVSAHRTGRRSLQYRLRDASGLQETVMSLLKDLQQALSAVAHRLTSLTKDPATANHLLNAATPPQSISGELDGEQMIFIVEDTDDADEGPFTQIMEELHEVVTCLLRFAMTLRNPARHDQMKRGATSIAKFFMANDIEHVRHKYPSAPEFFTRRLGRVISTHRQYFKYRLEHHEKLAEGIDDDDEEAERQSTVATSLFQDSQTADPGAVSDDIDTDTDTLYTATSYAQSLTGESTLAPPPWPEAGQSGEPFECPICYGVITADSERSWKQHVFEDLPPYVCTYEACLRGERPFHRRHEWEQHLAKAHERVFICPFGCAPTLTSAVAFEKHIGDNHAQSFEKQKLQWITETCARPRERVDTLACALCHREHSSERAMRKHVGHHMEQLALFALPRRLLGRERKRKMLVLPGASRIESTPHILAETKAEDPEAWGCLDDERADREAKLKSMREATSQAEYEGRMKAAAENERWAQMGQVSAELAKIV